MPPSSGQHEDPAAKPSPGRRAANSLPASFALALTGGFLDAFLYVGHGRVFAGAMTGNAVLFGITLLNRNWPDVLHHALPLLAFFCGVWLAEVLQYRLKHHAASLALACEIAGLLFASFLPAGFPDHVFVFAICLLAAFQIGSFGKAGKYSYSATYITGDLRTTIIALYQGIIARTQPDGAREARDLGLVFLCFLIGAAIGALLTGRLGNHALWLPVLLLSGVFALVLRASLRPEPLTLQT